eukprot:Plantae.Rhodophyta-Purpureofilum_apyrenoidigerum.ctg3334.p2 GENE.Plantae.Rhodophyta-Purpureofilum_apyrenoidigerum.ctg3334~~Plantae.Rhodophyta-Purpureofilum_apyrenoidigerum.ctg3334.p2  ORF type:complete len:115 (+),score=38.72 Plantae.Rhodophyta-Purpureofilum_apyrenoidigerum.ctg3334:145-489(+)
MTTRMLLMLLFLALALLCVHAQEEVAVPEEIGSDENDKPKDEDVAAAEEGANDETTKTQKKVMLPPEIEAGGLTALLVGGLLLAILIPGMLCLYNIQTPQKFEVPEKDAKSKAQ